MSSRVLDGSARANRRIAARVKAASGARSGRSGVSSLTVFRLSLYLRYLTVLESEGRKTVSSKELAEKFSVSAALVRKDLGPFGPFGTRGVGYEVKSLRRGLLSVLGLTRKWRVAIVGAGRLGIALSKHKGFSRGAFEVAAIFDKSPERATKRFGPELQVFHIDRLNEVISQRKIELGVIAVPGPSAQQVADELVSAGIKAILNFAPAHITVPNGVFLHNVDFTIFLETLAYYLNSAARLDAGGLQGEE